MSRKQKKLLLRILISATATVLLNLFPITGIARLLLFLATYLTVGYDVLRKAGLGIINLKLFNESFLMTIATVGAFILAIVEKSGDYNEAVAVMLLYQTGELFQSVAVGKSRRSIASLMDIRPDVANIEQDGRVVSVAAESREVGTVIWVNPGEKIAIDRIVIQGNSSLDTSEELFFHSGIILLRVTSSCTSSYSSSLPSLRRDSVTSILIGYLM